MSTDRLSRRLSRRERFRSRSGTAAGVCGAVALVATWTAAESVLAALGRPALLVAPDDALAQLADSAAWVQPTGIGLGVVGLILVIVALAPGRRARHRIDDDRLVVVADDDVLAGAVLRVAAGEARVAPDRVRASVGRRRARVTIVPPSGADVDAARVAERATTALAELRPRPAVTARVAVTPTGTVGA